MARAVASRRARDHRGVGVALHAEVLRAVVVGAVAVVLAVGLVVLALVGDQVAQGEPVVRGDEVDRRPRPAPGQLVQVGAAGQPGGHLADPAVAAPEVAHRVAVAPVPLRPGHAEPADPVALAGGVPRLGDQLHPATAPDRWRSPSAAARSGRTGPTAAGRARWPGRSGTRPRRTRVTQCRIASQTSRITVGEPESRVLPVPVMSASMPVAAQRVVRGRVQPAVAQRGAGRPRPRRCGWARRRGSPRCPARVQRRHHRGELLDLRARARSRSRRAGPGSRAWRSPSSCVGLRASSGGSSAIEVTGSSSTAVTPMRRRCSITAGWASPR